MTNVLKNVLLLQTKQNKIMRKILLSAGHSETPGRDRGASGNGYTEGVETAKMRRAIYDQLKVMGADVYRDPDNTILADSLKNFRQITNENAICLDIHFNAAASPKAKGTETYTQNKPTAEESALAEMLSEAVASTLDIPKRGTNGAKPESYSQHKNGLAWMRMPGVNVLMEICFISNPDEMKVYSEKFLELCCNIANTLYVFASGNCASDPQPVHLVKKGDTLCAIAKTYNTTVKLIKDLNALKNDTIHIGQKLFV